MSEKLSVEDRLTALEQTIADQAEVIAALSVLPQLRKAFVGKDAAIMAQDRITTAVRPAPPIR